MGILLALLFWVLFLLFCNSGGHSTSSTMSFGSNACLACLLTSCRNQPQLLCICLSACRRKINFGRSSVVTVIGGYCGTSLFPCRWKVCGPEHVQDKADTGSSCFESTNEGPAIIVYHERISKTISWLWEQPTISVYPTSSWWNETAAQGRRHGTNIYGCHI